MQHTETYSLNLIETSDTFSPAPLNENAQKIEAQLFAAQATQAADAAALDARVTALEAHKIAASSYTGDGTNNRIISVGFTPRAVVAQAKTGYYCWLTVDSLAQDGICIAEGGFKVSVPNGGASLNTLNTKYAYLALC